MEQSYFKEYYQLERENWWFTVRRKILEERIAHLLNKPTNISSLNIGAATGTTSDMLTSFGNVMSVEYDENCYQFTKSFLSTPIIQGSITELPFESNQYNLVCAFDVIEHVEDDAKAIDEMIRVCKPGGHIAITVPAYMFLWGSHDLVNHHYRRYTLKQLTSLIAQHNGSIVYTTYFNSILFIPIAIFRLIANMLEKIKGEKKATVESDHAVLGTNGFFNELLTLIFKIDYYSLKWGFRFPFGVSIMVFFQKQK
jgi:ubiquinone/menaquinone biosynthesis C-methylase UbiE